MDQPAGRLPEDHFGLAGSKAGGPRGCYRDAVHRAAALILLVTAGCHAAPPAPPPAPHRKYTLQQILGVTRNNTGSFSPDGQQLAYESNAGGTWQVWVVTAAGGQAPRQVTTLSSGLGPARWSPACDRVLYTADHDGDQDYQLYLVGADGSNVVSLTAAPDVKHDFGGWSRDGKQVFYASNQRDRRYFDCWTMDVDTREARLVLQRDAVMRAAALSADGRLLAGIERTSEVDQSVYVAETAGGEPRLLTPHQGVARFSVLGFSPDATRLYVVTDLDREFMNLAAIDVASGALAFLEDGSHDTDEALLSRDGRRIALSHNLDGYEVLEVVDAATGAALPLPELPSGVAFANDFSADGRELAVSVTTATHDDDVFVIDLEGRALRRITSGDQAGIDERDLVTPELIRYPARDGREIPAFLYLPHVPAGTRVPVIVSIHGGPESQELGWLDPSYQFVVNHGYALLAPNIRGSTGYGKSYLALDDGPKRWDALADVAAGVAWLCTRPDVDPQRIVAWGASYGGFAVLAMLVHYPDLFAAGVDWYGPSDLATFLGRTAEYRRAQRAAEYGDPVRDAAFLDEISPAKHADRITAPLLIMQGANDPIVPPAESEQLVESLKARGRNVRYVVFSDEGHGWGKRPNEIRAHEEMIDFLDSLWLRPPTAVRGSAPSPRPAGGPANRVDCSAPSSARTHPSGRLIFAPL